MDCPTCGLANPPEAVRCDCGYDFAAMKPTAIPGWRIHLTWTQKLAASWSITWPGWVGAFVTVSLLTGVYRRIGRPAPNLNLIALFGQVAFFGIQALLTRRIVRKNYRSFRVVVEREEGQKSRLLSVREAGQVWLWILGPQLALVLATLALSYYASRLSAENVNLITSLSLWLRILAAGPYGIGLALRAHYPGFRLQAYGS